MKRNEKNKFEDDDIDFLIDLLFDTNISIGKISEELNLPIQLVNKKINQLGLSWIKNQRKKSSRGQSALTSIMQKLLPGEKILNEYHIGDRLKLDVYCPKYNMAAEFHGRQHFYYTERFFDSKYDFEEAQKRDLKKIERCKELGIVLIVFRYNDSLTEQSVYDRMLEAVRSSNLIEEKPKKKSITSSSFYQQRKKNNSEYKKMLYKKIKDLKKDDDRG